MAAAKTIFKRIIDKEIPVERCVEFFRESLARSGATRLHIKGLLMNKHWLKAVVAIGVVITMGALLLAQADKPAPSGAAMSQAALTFLASISKEQQAQARF